MIRTASEILADLGIRTLRSTAPGNHKTICPRCSPARKHRKDPCLSITIGPDAVLFHCHHCTWSGGRSFDDQPSRRAMVGAPRHQPGGGGGYGALHRQARGGWR